MGRNFYLQFEECHCCGRCEDENRIHIGKLLTGGGVTLHGPNFFALPVSWREMAALSYNFHFKSWAQWRAFLDFALSQPKAAIRDSYREKVSLEQFVAWVEAAQKHPDAPMAQTRRDTNGQLSEWVDDAGFQFLACYFC